LNGWVRQAEKDSGMRDGITTEERDRIKALEWENRELRQANEILRKALDLVVTSPKQMSFFAPTDQAAHGSAVMPILIFHLGGDILGSVVPILRDGAVRAKVENNGRIFAGPSGMDAIKLAELQGTVLPYLPKLARTPAATDTCHCVLTRDDDFILDRLPSAPNVVVCSACSGHGFKFAPVLGDIVWDLTLSAATPHPRFAIARFAEVVA
jgi:glycine/D-amino acid oxidase-like deaminating enzyme